MNRKTYPVKKLVLDFRAEFPGDTFRKRAPIAGVYENYIDGRGQHGVCTTLYDDFPGWRLVDFIQDCFMNFDGTVVMEDN
jgi:hypothetical protein